MMRAKKRQNKKACGVRPWSESNVFQMPIPDNTGEVSSHQTVESASEKHAQFQHRISFQQTEEENRYVIADEPHQSRAYSRWDNHPAGIHASLTNIHLKDEKKTVHKQSIQQVEEKSEGSEGYSPQSG